MERESQPYIEQHIIRIRCCGSIRMKQRIAERVKMGGHGTPDKDVEKRFGKSLSNLRKIIGLCDLAALYDNKSEFRRFDHQAVEEYSRLVYKMEGRVSLT